LRELDLRERSPLFPPGSVAIFAPTSALAANTTYVATITTGVQNLAAPPASLAANFTWSFTTGAAPVTTPPTVISTNPLNNATGVPTNQAVSATFSKPMDPATINSTNFTVTATGGATVAGAVTYAVVGNTATFAPAANLAAGPYTATIKNRSYGPVGQSPGQQLYVVKTLHLVFRQVLRRSLVEVSGANEITPSGEENTSPDGVMVMARLAVSFGKLRYRSQRHEDAKRRRSHALPDWLSPRRS
jgi:Bacterial Ig-like domain